MVNVIGTVADDLTAKDFEQPAQKIDTPHQPGTHRPAIDPDAHTRHHVPTET